MGDARRVRHVQDHVVRELKYETFTIRVDFVTSKGDNFTMRVDFVTSKGGNFTIKAQMTHYDR